MVGEVVPGSLVEVIGVCSVLLSAFDCSSPLVTGPLVIPEELDISVVLFDSSWGTESSSWSTRSVGKVISVVVVGFSFVVVSVSSGVVETPFRGSIDSYVGVVDASMFVVMVLVVVRTLGKRRCSG